MIEKIKAAGMNKPTLGDAPLNLSAMLDNNGDLESGEEASRSGELLSWDVVQSTNDPMICRLRGKHDDQTGTNRGGAVGHSGPVLC